MRYTFVAIKCSLDSNLLERYVKYLTSYFAHKAYNKHVIVIQGETTMLWNIILWVLFGAVAGWIASMIMNTDGEQGAIGNIVVGIVGAFIGGFLVRVLTGADVNTISWMGLVVAVIGAVVLLAIVKAFRGRGVAE